MPPAKTNENALDKIRWALNQLDSGSKHQNSAIHNTIHLSKTDESTRTPCDLNQGGTHQGETVCNRIF